MSALQKAVLSLLLFAPLGLAAAPSTADSSAVKPANPPTGSAVAAPPAVDPAAIALVSKSRDAYKSLKAFSANVEGLDFSGVFAYEKPNKLRFEVNVTKPNAKSFRMAAVSDGKTRTVIPYFDQKHYYRGPATQAGIASMGEEAWLYRLSVSSLVYGNAPYYLDQIINRVKRWKKTDHDPYRLVSAQVEAPATADGVPVDVVDVVETTEEGIRQYRYEIRFLFGHEDHLIRELKETITQINAAPGKKPVTVQLTEQYTNVKVADSLPDSTFAYTPPAGVTLGSSKVLAAKEDEAHRYYDKRLVVGAKPFTFKAVDLHGKPVNLDQYQGKVLVMDFWATWCGPCCEELPNVVATYRKYRPCGVEVIGISLDNQKSDLTDYVRENKIPYRMVFDGKGWNNSVASLYKVRAIPFAMVIGRDGRIVAVDVRGAALQAAVAKALAE